MCETREDVLKKGFELACLGPRDEIAIFVAETLCEIFVVALFERYERVPI